MDQSSLLSLWGAELKKMELSSTMIFLLTDRKMLLSSSKPIMIATRGMPGIPLNRESESVEDVHRVLRALPLFREMEGILRERNLNLPSVQEISAFRVNLFSGIARESAIADYDAFWRPYSRRFTHLRDVVVLVREYKICTPECLPRATGTT
ncbi:cytochrome oxidase 2 [Zea mays]|uniref:Cytochrome oxidase 2 n=1 Tax=Zea mays TaxID=4577 RepID=A0A1D6ED92_MAIZE|nr:cytochrome oxidase 2 [Zea mays]